VLKDEPREFKDEKRLFIIDQWVRNPNRSEFRRKLPFFIFEFMKQSSDGIKPYQFN
jgi:hypothetical protein